MVAEGWVAVGGHAAVIQQLKEMVLLPLQYPDVFKHMGITPPRCAMQQQHCTSLVPAWKFVLMYSYGGNGHARNHFCCCVLQAALTNHESQAHRALPGCCTGRVWLHGTALVVDFSSLWVSKPTASYCKQAGIMFCTQMLHDGYLIRSVLCRAPPKSGRSVQ